MQGRFRPSLRVGRGRKRGSGAQVLLDPDGPVIANWTPGRKATLSNAGGARPHGEERKEHSWGPTACWSGRVKKPKWEQGLTGGELSQLRMFFVVGITSVYCLFRRENVGRGRRNRPANYLAVCMNERCSVHISTMARITRLYLGISPPPDFSFLPQIVTDASARQLSLSRTRN